MKTTKKRFIALLCIVCILLFSPSVFAANVIHNVTVIGGADGLIGVMRTSDFFTVQADVELDSGVRFENVVLGSSLAFSSCDAQATRAICTIRFPNASTESFASDAFPFSVNLRDGSRTFDSVSTAVVVDTLAPQFTFTQVSPRTARNEDIRFDFVASDQACTSDDCVGRCSGIKQIEFFTVDRTFFDTLTLDTASCNVTDTLVVPSADFGHGNHDLVARVTDRFGHTSTLSQIGFEVEHQPPTLDGIELNLSFEGFTLTHAKPQTELQVLAQARVPDNDLTRLTADFSSLHTSQDLSSLVGECTRQSSDEFLCAFRFPLRINSGGVFEVTLNATDASSNAVGHTLALRITADQTGPLPSAITADGRTGFAQSRSDIEVIFSETGIGVKPEDMIIEVDGRRVFADACDRSRCEFFDVSLGRNTVEIVFSDDSTDLFGNNGGELVATFEISTEQPFIENAFATGVGGLTSAIQTAVVIGDRIGVFANVSAPLGVERATIDISDFIPGSDVVQGDCTTLNGSVACTWLTEPAQVSGTGRIVVDITDTAGATVSEVISFEVFDKNTDDNPEFWRHTVRCAPQTLDRQLGTLINQKSYCTISLIPVVSSPQTISTTLVGCTGDSETLIENVELFNAEPGSANPLLKFTFSQDDFRIDRLQTSCTLDIHTLVNGEVTTTPEQEVITATFSFANLPLGEISSEVQEKIDTAKENALSGFNGMIGTLDDLVSIASKLCNLIQQLYSFVGVFHETKDLIAKRSTAECYSGSIGCVQALDTKLKTCQAAQKNHEAADNQLQGKQPGKDSGKKPGLKENLMTWCRYVNCEIPAPGILGDLQQQTSSVINQIPGGEFLPAGSYAAEMTPQGGLMSSAMFGCVPGVIKNLNKYRNIECLYADCLESAVKEDNVPIESCENLKAQATCKYVTNEVFAVIPFTNIFDKYIGQIKSVLSDPMSALGVIPGLVCKHACTIAPDSGTLHQACAGLKIVSKVAAGVREVQGIIQNGVFENRNDFCSKLEESEGEDEGYFGGLF